MKFFQHTSRTFHNADLSVGNFESGFFVMPVDRRYNTAKGNDHFLFEYLNI